MQKGVGNHLDVGLLGESLGVRYLKKKGYRILDTRYTNTSGYRLGEVDIIAQKGRKVVFVEVKTRTKSHFDDSLPEQNITQSKLRRLQRISAVYLRERRLLDREYSFDALAIVYDSEQKKAQIRHLEDIFL
ncbi:MAG: YraN family protein [Patescibacteria group bacterium]